MAALSSPRSVDPIATRGAPPPVLAGAETVLIFPAGMPAGVRHNAEARARGFQVIGASSLEFDPVKSEYESWEYLPYISDAAFEDVLCDVVRRRGVTSIYTPHFVTWLLLQEKLAAIAPGVRLLDGDTMLQQETAYRELRARLARVPLDGPSAPALMGAKAPLSAVERNGLVRLIDTIPGMCNEEKLLAVIDAMRCCPRGDIVEIGSWWGKSAALFAWLAQRYEIGALLCLDPWRRENLAQADALVDRASAAMDPDEALRIFEINLAPLANGRVNYIRAASHDAAGMYAPGLIVETPAFGATRYDGAIAMLHIDGNHAYEHAAEDERDWTRHVMPGGWIIIDDYLWPFGDGPKRVGDDFLAREDARIAQSFVAGTALFIQLAV